MMWVYVIFRAAVMLIVIDMHEIIVLLDMNFWLCKSLSLLPYLFLERGEKLFPGLIVFSLFDWLLILSASWKGFSLITLFFFFDNNDFKVLLFWHEFLNKGKIKVKIRCFIVFKLGLMVTNHLYFALIHFMETIKTM